MYNLFGLISFLREQAMWIKHSHAAHDIFEVTWPSLSQHDWRQVWACLLILAAISVLPQSSLGLTLNERTLLQCEASFFLIIKDPTLEGLMKGYKVVQLCRNGRKGVYPYIYDSLCSSSASAQSSKFRFLKLVSVGIISDSTYTGLV